MADLSATMTRIFAISVNGAVWPALTVRHATLCSPVAIVCRAGLASTHVQSVAMWGTERTLDPNAGEEQALYLMRGCHAGGLFCHVSFHRHTSTSFISALGHIKVRPRYRIWTNTDPEITYWSWHREGGSWGTFIPPIAPEWQHANRSSGCRQRPTRQPRD